MTIKENGGKIINWLEKKLEKSNLSKGQKRSILLSTDLVLNIVIIVALVMFIRTFIVSPFQVYGISMCNSFNYSNGTCHDSYGDYILINKSAYLHLPWFALGNPQRGDVIVFRPPQNKGEFYIKRVIGLPGESIRLIDGFVWVYNEQNPNGFKLQENYLSDESLGKTYATGDESVFEIPKDHYFVLGDNRQHSSDSRICFKESAGSPGCESAQITPFLTLDMIEGKAAFVLWPMPKLVGKADYSQT